MVYKEREKKKLLTIAWCEHLARGVESEDLYNSSCQCGQHDTRDMENDTNLYRDMCIVNLVRSGKHISNQVGVVGAISVPQTERNSVGQFHWA